MSPTAYLVVSNNVVFIIPIDPGNRANITANSTEKKEREALRLHAKTGANSSCTITPARR